MSSEIIEVQETWSILKVNQLIKKGYKVWGKPNKLWIAEEQRHMLVYTLVLIADKDHSMFETYQKLNQKPIGE